VAVAASELFGCLWLRLRLDGAVPGGPVASQSGLWTGTAVGSPDPDGDQPRRLPYPHCPPSGTGSDPAGWANEPRHADQASCHRAGCHIYGVCQEALMAGKYRWDRLVLAGTAPRA